MDLITDPTAVAAVPALPSPLSGTRGYFTGGTPGVVAATRVRYWWLNLIAQELVNILVAAGITPDPTQTSQLLQALYALPGKNLVTFGTIGTTDWNVPANVTRAQVLLWAGGGGGGFSSGTTLVGGAGSGGGFGQKLLTLTAGEILAISIGAGGVAGTSASPTGGNGGSSSVAFSTNGGSTYTGIFSCTGGAGGVPNTTSAVVSGGTATGADFALAGPLGYGGYGNSFPEFYSYGSAYLFGQNGYGAGGPGAINNAGGVGQPGFAMVIY